MKPTANTCLESRATDPYLHPRSPNAPRNQESWAPDLALLLRQLDPRGRRPWGWVGGPR